MMNGLDADALDWSKNAGLIPAIAQDARDGRVLMFAYMNREALAITQRTGWVTFYSRRRQRLWVKGETSGNHLKLASLHTDCDADTLLVLAEPTGSTCHTGADTCFGGTSPELTFLARLDALIAERKLERPESSYTAELFAGGVSRIAQKVGEEAVETALAAVGESDEALLGEAADLVYHLLVLLRTREASLENLIATLAARHNDAEGAARQENPINSSVV